MQRVASMSVVVKANGVSEAFYNGQRDRVVEAVRAEAAERIRQAKAEVEVERDRADINARNCNRLRAEKLAAIKAQYSRRPGIFRRAADAIVSAYACAWATASLAIINAWVFIYTYTVGRAWIDVLIFLKMLERDDD